MANVSHASLTGSSLHEPKGVETATVGQAYLATGTGTGAWTTLSGLSLTGLIAPFVTPIAPSGWYECNGATISDVTDAALYTAMTIQGTANRVSGSAVISGISSTTNMKAGYFVFGTGITAGTTILSVDSPTDITMSANAGSSGSSTVIVSPWQLVSGGAVLPDMTTAGKYLRSRTSSVRMGTAQTSQNKTHTHGFTTSGDSLSGTVITSSTESANHTHNYNTATSKSTVTGTSGSGIHVDVWSGVDSNIGSGGKSATHTHTTTIPGHTHTGTTDADGSFEARPESLVVMWCVKR